MKKIYLDEIEEVEKELVNLSEKNIKDNINELKLLPNSFIWNGKANTSYVKEYNKIIKKLEIMNNGLTKIASFLLAVKEEYQTTTNKIENAYEELAEEFRKLGDIDELQ